MGSERDAPASGPAVVCTFAGTGAPSSSSVNGLGVNG